LSKTIRPGSLKETLTATPIWAKSARVTPSDSLVFCVPDVSVTMSVNAATSTLASRTHWLPVCTTDESPGSFWDLPRPTQDKVLHLLAAMIAKGVVDEDGKGGMVPQVDRADKLPC
jgi:hypothetical protein